MDITKKLKFKSNSFSGIYANQVLEHLKQPLLTMKEFHRILKPGGKLVCIAPHFTYRRFWDDYTHIRPFSRQSLYRLAYDSGFKKIKTDYYFFYLKGSRRLLSFSQLVSLHRFLNFQLGLRNKENVLLEAIK